jgi:hypothetical protein
MESSGQELKTTLLHKTKAFGQTCGAFQYLPVSYKYVPLNLGGPSTHTNVYTYTYIYVITVYMHVYYIYMHVYI